MLVKYGPPAKAMSTSESVAVTRTGGVPALRAYAPLLIWISVLIVGLLVQAQEQLTDAMVVALIGVTVLQVVTCVAFYPFLRQPRRFRIAVLGIALVLVVMAPFLIPSDARALRFVTSCASVILVMKLWDLHVHATRGHAVEWSRFVSFICNVFAVVLRKHEDEVRPPRDELMEDLARGAGGSVAGILAVACLYTVRWRDYPLLVEHSVKAVVIFLSVLAWFCAAIAIVRLCGGVIRDFSDKPWLARTPADFWRRYNRVVQQYFYENVFKPAGGRRSPIRATLLIFFLSGLIHEYVFGIAIGGIQGFQMAFFMIQGLAVAATLRVRPAGSFAVFGWTAATLVFNVVTSFLFFLSFHAILKLYANPLPSWLQ